jgi:hypothetical protein
MDIALTDRLDGLSVPCREWPGAKWTNGYGRLHSGRDGSEDRAHVSAFLTVYGPLLPGMMVCHTCDNPPCYEPRHLFAGSNSTNQLDAVAKGRHGQTRKTHCPKGHPYDEQNTYIRPGRRGCRECRKRVKAAQKRNRRST